MKRKTKKVLFFFILLIIALSIKLLPIIDYNYPLSYLHKLQNEKTINSNKFVIPGGQTIGVELKTKGVLVVGLADILSSDKITTSPARKSGLKIGDKIISIDNKTIKNINDIILYTNKNKIKKYTFLVDRNNKKIELEIIPVENYNGNDIKFGFWARDNIAGIGTITFINPETCEYRAIGHGITDTDTSELIDIDSGIVAKTQVTNIKAGKKGEPGEIVGYIMKEDGYLGNVKNNSRFGIYGIIDKRKMNYFTNELLKIGSRDDIHTGPATIYATVNDEVKEYNIEIIKLYRQLKPAPKSMIIKIIDEELLELTNGIIQGMSGCPIIQDNKIVGSVTHVFMNDPSKGYGIYIEWLFEEIYNNSSNI